MKTLSTFDLAPSAENPRNSEGDFLRLKDGSILFVYSHFSKGASDDAESQIAGIVSRDNGMTWKEYRVLFTTGDFPGAQNIMSVSMLRMQDGALGLFFVIRYSFADSRLHLFRSYDEGRTFSEPVCCIPNHGYFVTNNCRVLRTSSGRLIVPCSYHICKFDEKNARDQRGMTGHGIGYFFYSDDDGKTWNESRNFCRYPFAKSDTGLQEPGVIELKPGVIMAYFRTDLGMQYSSYSYDNGDTWGTVEPLFYFTSPISPMKIERLDNGDLIAVWNPTPSYTGRPGDWRAFRNPLSVAFSHNSGKSWDLPEIIECDPDSGYSYPAIFNDGDLLILGYCAGSIADGGNLNRLRIRTINL